MGGVVPLGYRVEDRALHGVEDHAAIVRMIFRRYLDAGSVVRLKQILDAEDIRLPVRVDGTGRSNRRRAVQPGPSLQDPVEPDLHRPDRSQEPGA